MAGGSWGSYYVKHGTFTQDPKKGEIYDVFCQQTPQQCTICTVCTKACKVKFVSFFLSSAFIGDNLGCRGKEGQMANGFDALGMV